MTVVFKNNTSVPEQFPEALHYRITILLEFLNSNTDFLLFLNVTFKSP